MEDSCLDRRRFPRTRKMVQLTLRYDGEDHLISTTDVSPRGAFIHTDLRIPLYATISLVGRWEQQKITVVGQVVRVVDRQSRFVSVPGFGIEWRRFHGANVPGLCRFMVDLLSTPPGDFNPELLRTTGDPAGNIVYYLESRYLLELVEEVSRSYRDTVPMERTGDQPIERRLFQRYPVNLEAQYFHRGIPYMARILNLSRNGLCFQTRQTIPEVGTPIVCKTHLTGVFSEQWLRVEGVVDRLWHPPTDGDTRGFTMRIENRNEGGSDDLFERYLRYLHGLARVDSPPNRSHLRVV